MAMTVVVTRDVQPRFRGFLASVMLEAAPGVYVQPRMNPQVRIRVWAVLSEWHADLGGSLVMLWQDNGRPGGLGLETLGSPPREMVEVDGLFLSRTALDKAERKLVEAAERSLKREHPFLPSRGRPPAPELIGPGDHPEPIEKP